MRTSNESGFSLIEVLVSILILTIGVIGTAAMQMTALRTTQQSTMQSSALHLAIEMADKMRANTALMRQGDTLNPYLNIDHRFSATGHASAALEDCYAAACDATQLASFDITGWLRRVDAALPAARVRVCRDSANASQDWDCSAAAHGTISIKIGWRDKDEEPHDVMRDSPRVALTVAPYAQ